MNARPNDAEQTAAPFSNDVAEQTAAPSPVAAVAVDAITVDIDDGAVTPDVGDRSTGWQASLLLDPEARAVTVWTRVGAGSPEAVTHKRVLTVHLPPAASGKSVREIATANLGCIEAIFALYQGAEWDGQHHVGRWGGGDGGRELEGLLDALRADLADVACHWPASAWLEPDWNESKRAVQDALLADSDLDALAAEWVHKGRDQDAVVEVGEVREQIDAMVGELRGEGDEAVYVVRGADASALGDDDELPDARTFGEAWKVVEATGAIDAVMKARALDGAGAAAELERLIEVWDEDYLAGLLRHLGRTA